MSRLLHRTHAWGPLSVVLLSALLLSPRTGAALLHVLAQALPPSVIQPGAVLPERLVQATQRKQGRETLRATADALRTLLQNPPTTPLEAPGNSPLFARLPDNHSGAFREIAPRAPPV